MPTRRWSPVTGDAVYTTYLTHIPGLPAIRQTVASHVKYSTLSKRRPSLTETETGKLLKSETKLKLKNLF